MGTNITKQPLSVRELKADTTSADIGVWVFTFKIRQTLLKVMICEGKTGDYLVAFIYPFTNVIATGLTLSEAVKELNDVLGQLRQHDIVVLGNKNTHNVLVVH